MEWDCSGHSTAAAQMEDETTHVRSDRRKCLGNMGVDVPLHRRVPAALTRQTPYHYWHVFSSDDASTEDEEGVGESMAVESEVCVLGNSCVAHACTLCGIFSARSSPALSHATQPADHMAMDQAMPAGSETHFTTLRPTLVPRKRFCDLEPGCELAAWEVEEDGEMRIKRRRSHRAQ